MEKIVELISVPIWSLDLLFRGRQNNYKAKKEFISLAAYCVLK